MFKELKRIVYQVSEVEAAKRWYATVLGSDPAFDSPVAAIFRIGGGSMSLAKASPGAHDAAARTIGYWEVDDVDRAYARLLELGATAKAPPANVLTLRTAQVADPFGNLLGLTGAIPHDQQRTIENQPSETAHVVAFCRALMARDPRPEIRRHDPFSELFLRDQARAALEDEARCRGILDRQISRPLYGFFVARSGFIDEAFLRALRAGVPQIVLLGAGYDTRALRFAAELGATRIIELDAPSTQGRKASLLRSSGTKVPEQVRFVSINFKTDDLAERLQSGGYDPSSAALFLWEGVTYYLPQEAVDRTMQWVSEHTAAGSGIVFDYMTKKLDSINSGEPFLSWMEPAALPEWLHRHGFDCTHHLDPAEMVRRYLTLDDGTQAEKPLSTIRLVYAVRSAAGAKP